MKKSVLFFDIDGTILSEITQEVPVSAVHALKAAQEAGHLTFINTGRTICNIPTELAEIPFDGFLCGCGIYLTYHDRVLFETHLSMERADEIAREVYACGLDGIFEGADDIYFPSEVSRFYGLENIRRYINNRGLGLERYIEQGGCPFDKLFIYTDEQSDKERFFKFISKDLQIIDRGNGNYECAPKGYSKWTAIEKILEKFGIEKEQSYVFGDSSNDLAMFQDAGHAIAMKVHDSVLDPYTEFVTKTVEDDGIAYALKHYGLI